MPKKQEKSDKNGYHLETLGQIWTRIKNPPCSLWCIFFVLFKKKIASVRKSP